MLRTKVAEKIGTRYVEQLFLNHVIYEIMWKHCSAGQATDDNMMCIVCWIPKATNMHEICEAAFPLQQ
jgi:hypothetical protein